MDDHYLLLCVFDIANGFSQKVSRAICWTRTMQLGFKFPHQDQRAFTLTMAFECTGQCQTAVSALHSYKTYTQRKLGQSQSLRHTEMHQYLMTRSSSSQGFTSQGRGAHKKEGRRRSHVKSVKCIK